MIGANYDEYGRRQRDSDRNSERGAKEVVLILVGVAIRSWLSLGWETMHGENAMTQRQLAMMQDENRKCELKMCPCGPAGGDKRAARGDSR